MDFKVLIADSAIANLKEIVEFVAEDNREAALRLGEKLLAHALSLATMPLPPFLIYYVCDESASVVNILHFWHGARQRPEFSG